MSHLQTWLILFAFGQQLRSHVWLLIFPFCLCFMTRYDELMDVFFLVQKKKKTFFLKNKIFNAVSSLAEESGKF